MTDPVYATPTCSVHGVPGIASVSLTSRDISSSDLSLASTIISAIHLRVGCELPDFAISGHYRSNVERGTQSSGRQG